MARGGKREGAGRPKGSTKVEVGMPSRVKRIPGDLTDELVDNIIPLRDLLNHWEDECLVQRGRNNPPVQATSG